MRSSRRRRIQAGLGLLAAVLTASISIRYSTTPTPARAHVIPQPVQVGVSFSLRRAEHLGLDPHAAYRQVLGMHFKVIRLPIYWDEIDQRGYGDLDWTVQQAQDAGQPIVLTVGMKSLGWPEYFIPPDLVPRSAGDGSDLSLDPGLRAATLAFVEQTVQRYQNVPALVAWQVENEPFNRAGPHRWWLGEEFLRQELALVRSIDNRPVVINAFTHFNMGMDRASSPRGFDLRALLGFGGDGVEKRSLALLQPGDVLGLDVYTRMAYPLGGQARISQADPDWDASVARWQATATQQFKRAWVTEAQAEPWEIDHTTLDNPRSFAPEDMETTFGALKQSGASTVLLWGAEYWLYRASRGDTRWLAEAQTILAAESK